MNYFTPIILNISHFTRKSPESSPVRIVMDYEFDFYLNHKREMFINDTHYTIRENDLVFRKPGQTVKSIGDYDCYILSIDFSGTHIVSNYSRNKANIMQKEYDSPLLHAIPPVFNPTHSEEIKLLFKKLNHEFKKDGNSTVTHKLLMQLLLQIGADCYDTSDITYYDTDDVISDICYYLSSNLKEEINLDYLARHFGFNKSYLIRKFKKEIGMSPINYLINLRLDNAKKLLKRTDYSIQEISYLCGYSDYAFFSTSFKKKFSLSPMEYRKSILKRN